MGSIQHTSVPNQRPWFLNPAVIFYTTWILVGFLYCIHLSSLLLFPLSTVLAMEIPLLGAFLVVYLATRYVMPRRRKVEPAVQREPFVVSTVLENRLRFWFRFWICMTVIEIIVSGGIPIVWALTGSSKTYFDFGITQLHGFLNALILAIAVTRFALWLKYGRKKDLLYPLFSLVWSIVCLARQLSIVLLIEVAILFLMYRTLKKKRLIALIATVLIFITLFGISGDLRSGRGDSEGFRRLAQVNDNYPRWIPSGFLWVYLYMTTPLNNLLNTWTNVHPLNDYTMPNTLAFVLPQPVRILLGQKADITVWSGDIVTQSFNVSTAYVGPVQDLGILGVMEFSAFVGFITCVYWLKSGLRNDLVFAVLAQCLVLTIFFNQFFLLPIISQVFWIYIFFGRRVSFGPEPATSMSHIAANVQD
jgi:oligosaccharide repeat unit polymerase